jgi:glycogen operon protein
MHAGEQEEDFVLPGEPYGRAYRLIVDTTTGSAEEQDADISAGATLSMAPRSMLVLHALV